MAVSTVALQPWRLYLSPSLVAAIKVAITLSAQHSPDYEATRHNFHTFVCSLPIILLDITCSPIPLHSPPATDEPILTQHEANRY